MDTCPGSLQKPRYGPAHYPKQDPDYDNLQHGKNQRLDRPLPRPVGVVRREPHLPQVLDGGQARQPPGLCRCQGHGPGPVYEEQCEAEMPFVCQGGLKSRRVLMKLKMESDDDLERSTTSAQLLQQLEAQLRSQGYQISNSAGRATSVVRMR
ncbi:unnamed protein product [Arctogadus glacialis]